MSGRRWQGSEGDDGSVHVVGNGRICAYGQGPDLIQVFGPPYSGPWWGSLTVEGEGQSCVSTRESGAAVWTHELSDGQGPVASFTDFAAGGTTAIIRRFACRRPLRLRHRPGHVHPGGSRTVDDTAARLPAGVGVSRHILVPRGCVFYGKYPFPEDGHAVLQVLGQVTAWAVEAETVLELAGEGMLLLVGGPDLPTAVQQAEEVRQLGAEALLVRTRAAWRSFQARRRPLAEAEAGAADMADSVAVLIKAQQGESGGVLAGHNYHLAYIRDMYGASRGLLELGLYDEARAILDSLWATWQAQGAVHTAQPIGLHTPVHIHEEDRSENTGYLVAQAMDWLDATGDHGPVESWQPMLDWAIDQQLQVLRDETLPFSGDETYVAGGMLPRLFLDHGSAEATLLFIASSRRFAAWAVRRGRWTPRRRDQVLAAVDACAAAYRRHFLIDGRLYANDPARHVHGPRFRHGVCTGCQMRQTGGLAWLERDAHGHYLCPVCFARGVQPAFERTHLEIASVSLVPGFVGDGPLAAAEVEVQVRRLAAAWENSGRLPSQVGSAGPTVGYDYGFLLLGMDRCGLPGAERLARTTLGLLDPAGAWVEYYRDGTPCGTRCRPWESAINCLAILQHLQRVSREWSSRTLIV
jgi:hypothetical protein